MRIPLVTATLLTATVIPAAAQNGPFRVLTKPDAEFATPFISIAGLRELKDGRVIVADSRDVTLQLVDFAAHSATPIGAKGRGPGEYLGASRLFALGGDTTAMYDGANGRFLLIGADAKPAGTVLTPPQLRGPYDLRSGDMHGRIYANLRAHTDAMNQIAESGPVLRYVLASQHVDTVAMRRVSKTDMWTGAAGGLTTIRTEGVPFAVHDDWAAFQDGRIAIVHGNDYHVEYIGADGTKISGPPTTFVKVAVIDADKDSVRAARKPRPGAGGAAASTAETEPSVWYPTKAPFGENSAWAGPDGELWVAIAQKAGLPLRFDVFDAKGVRRTSIAMPAGSRVIGFGARSIYAVRTDADDQQFLQRFDLRKPSARPPQE